MDGEFRSVFYVWIKIIPLHSARSIIIHLYSAYINELCRQYVRDNWLVEVNYGLLLKLPVIGVFNLLRSLVILNNGENPERTKHRHGSAWRV